MNVSILNDKIYTDKIKNSLVKTKHEYKHMTKQLIWEICKIKIKEYTILYCKHKQKVKTNLMEELENKVQVKEMELINSNYCKSVQAERDTLVKELHNIIYEKNRGAQIRSRAKWLEEGEKPTKYFFQSRKAEHIKQYYKKAKKRRWLTNKK